MARFNFWNGFKKVVRIAGFTMLSIIVLPIVIFTWLLATILMLPLWILSLLLGGHKGL